MAPPLARRRRRGSHLARLAAPLRQPMARTILRLFFDSSSTGSRYHREKNPSNMKTDLAPSPLLREEATKVLWLPLHRHRHGDASQALHEAIRWRRLSHWHGPRLMLSTRQIRRHHVSGIDRMDIVERQWNAYNDAYWAAIGQLSSDL
jgi:hypothetical protein